MTLRSKIATSALAVAALTVGIASADAARHSGSLAHRHAHAPKHVHVVGHAPAFKLPGSAGTCQLASCKPHRHPGGTGSDDGSGQPGNADHGDDGGGGPDTHNCAGDRDCAPFHEN
jgi:hypothetical protein